jgi:hypothetical protein
MHLCRHVSWPLLLLNNLTEVGFEALTAVVMTSTIFWDITPCIPLSVNRRFGGTYRLHLQGRKNKFSKKPTAFFWRYVPLKRRLTLSGLHGVISQKIIRFNLTKI